MRKNHEIKIYCIMFVDDPNENTDLSSVGRALDCRIIVLYNSVKTKLISSGRWFDSVRSDIIYNSKIVL